MIPHVIHQVWLGGPLPGHLEDYVETWLDHHPGWSYHLWDEGAIEDLELVNADLYERADQLTVPNHAAQLRSDIARIEILHRHGGVYADADFECMRPLDDLVATVEHAFTAWEVDHEFLNLAICGFEPGHPYLEDLIVGLADNVAAHPTERPNRQSGPHYWTRVWRERHSEDVVVFPSAMFFPYSYRDKPQPGSAFPGAFAVHHWNNWRTNMRKGRR